MAVRPRILVAEDDPDVLRMLEHILKALGTIVTATNGEEALARAAQMRPDVIVTDIMMPKLDGLGLAQKLKRDPALRGVPLVMLTAKTAPRDVIAGINAGARFYLTKPFKTEELVAKVQKALASRTS